jgi:ribosomal protein S27E
MIKLQKKADTGRRVVMIRNAIQRFMYGRYGHDQLNLFLLGLYLVLYLISALARITVLSWVSAVLLIFVLFRMLSRNFDRRHRENAQFMKLAGPVIQWFRLQRTIRRDREHRYFKCPSCGQQLRVPRGKGKITVTCRGCGASFQEKS